MSVEQSVRLGLLQDFTISDMIGERLYLVQIPQNPTFPCGSIQRIGTQRIYSFYSASGHPGTTGMARLQLTWWAGGKDGGDTVLALSGATVIALSSIDATKPPGYVLPNGLTQHVNRVVNQISGMEPETRQPLFKSILFLNIWFGEENN